MSVTSEHLSDLALDRLLADESSGLDEARAHLEACGTCRDALAARRAERDAWRAGADRAAFVHAVREAADAEASASATVVRPDVGAWWGPGRLVAAATSLAAAAAMMTVALSRPEEPFEHVALKGDSTVTLLVVRGRASRPIREGERLAAGDRIGMSASCPQGCQVYLHDPADGHASLLAQPLIVPASSPKVLDFTATLDDAPGDEHVEVLMCGAAVPDEERRAALAAGTAPPDCASKTVRIPRAEGSE